MSPQFPEVRTEDQLRRLAGRVITKGEPRRIGRDRTAYWLDGTVVIVDPHDEDGGACFRPVDATPFATAPARTTDREGGGTLQLGREGLEILHGALREGWNDLVRAEAEVTETLGAPGSTVLRLILELGVALSLPYSVPSRGPHEWYWSQLLPVASPRPERLEAIRYDIALSGPEVSVVGRIIPIALAVLEPEFECRVGYPVEDAVEMQDSLLGSLEG